MINFEEGIREYNKQQPSVGRVVHYRALGSADGKFPVGECRAAIITAVGTSDEEGKTLASLAVFNPTGMYFNQFCSYSEEEVGGTWHWPERV